MTNVWVGEIVEAKEVHLGIDSGTVKLVSPLYASRALVIVGDAIRVALGSQSTTIYEVRVVGDDLKRLHW